jgi:hypothetical protein
VNITNTRINNFNNVVRPTHFANQGVRGGFTAVPHSTLTGAQSVARTAVPVSASAMKSAQPLSHVPIQPTHTSMLGANAGHPASAPPSRSQSRPVFSRLTPPASSARSNGAQGGSKPVQSASLTKTGAAGSNTGTRGGETTARPTTPAAHAGNSVARPASASPSGGTVPRPPQSAANRGGVNGAGNTSHYSPSTPSSRTSVPRPAGNVRPSSDWNRYNSTHPAVASSANRGGSSPNSGSGGHYSAPPASRGGSYGGYSPRGGGGSAPAYHGSAPAYHAPAPSGGHSGGGSAPHASGGGGHAGGGGGHGGGGHR